MLPWRGYVLMGATAGFIAAAVSLAVGYLFGPRMRPLQEPPPILAQQPIAPHAGQVPFPDFGYAPPAAQYKGPLFHLRQNYPDPKYGAKQPDFLNIPFNENEKEQNWLKYLVAVRAYCFEGNVEVDWDVSKNEIRGWYHVPWQHWGRNGREGIRGLTREATAHAGQLAATQTDDFQTYAVGFYNDIGGITIGEVWRDHLDPDYQNVHFGVGTVVFKLLFTQATGDQVPYLKPPVEWEAYAETSDKDQTRRVQKLRLLQMDVMVRDERATKINGTGWVFGTYCYNGKVGSKNPYENLVPVGIQWGNDMSVTDDKVNAKPVKTINNPDLKETVINPSEDLPAQHLGWNGRLNGPADYFASSCVSCHSTAQYPVLRQQNPDFGKRKVKHGPGEWMDWFRNLKCGHPFSENSHSTDFSLQLAISINNFYQWHDHQGGFSAHAEPVVEIKRGND